MIRDTPASNPLAETEFPLLARLTAELREHGDCELLAAWRSRCRRSLQPIRRRGGKPGERAACVLRAFELLHTLVNVLAQPRSDPSVPRSAPPLSNTIPVDARSNQFSRLDTQL